MKKNRRQLPFAVAWLAGCCLMMGLNTHPDFAGQSKAAISPDTRNLARQAALAVGLVLVRNSNDPGPARPRASAVVVGRSGLVVTNYHVITQDNAAKTFDELFINLSNGDFANPSPKRYRMRSLLVNPQQDLALLKIVADGNGNPLPQNAVFPALEIGDSNKVKLLDDLIIIGYPEKGGTTVTINMGRVEGKDNLENWIKTDARLIHGNSGGAAIDTEGKLIGIPTKVLADTRKVDKDGDGFPDEETPLGSIGFLRPANLIVEMIERAGNADHVVAKNLPSGNSRMDRPSPGQNPPPTSKSVPRPPVQLPGDSTGSIIIRGVLRAAGGGGPIAGARVGIVPLGEATVTTDNLLAWGSTKVDGAFALNRAVPTGRYTLKARAIGYEPFSQDIEVTQNNKQIIIDLQKSR